MVEVEEAIAVHREFIDYPLDDWLHLHEGEDASADLLVEHLYGELEELADRDPAFALLVEVALELADMVEGKLRSQTVAHRRELIA